ncbi:MAG TPA: nuclear transport factor 2 family protein [Rhizomicrobium sp.]|nr:nuclear transport factor 2 family protein [Rhizomicrobium sp.]
MDALKLLEAEAAVRRLIGHYAHLVDSRRLNECERLFAEDATLEVLGETWHGRSEVRRWLDSLNNWGPPGKHMVCNHVVSWSDGGPLTAVSDFMVFKDLGGAWTSNSRGAYHDEFVHHNGGLLFQRRRIEVMFAKGAPTKAG